MYLSFCILAFCASFASVAKCATLLPNDLEVETYKIVEVHDPIAEECKTKHNVPEEIITKLHAHHGILVSHPETQCYAACLLIARNTLKPDGTLNMSQVNEELPNNVADRENVIAAFKSCADKTGKDVCETSYNTITCINSHETIKNIHPSA